MTKHAAVAFAEWLTHHLRRSRGPRQLPVPDGREHPAADDGWTRAASRRVVTAAARVLEPEEVADAVVDGLATSAS